MGKVGYKLPKPYKEKAIDNGISLQTVYCRLERGWDLERAVTEDPRKNRTPIAAAIDSRDEEGNLKSVGRPKGKLISFTPYRDMEDILNQAIEESGKSRSVFIADAMEEYIGKLWQPKAKKKNHRRTKTK
jgi:hypothetical protein